MGEPWIGKHVQTSRRAYAELQDEFKEEFTYFGSYLKVHCRELAAPVSDTDEPQAAVAAAPATMGSKGTGSKGTGTNDKKTIRAKVA